AEKGQEAIVELLLKAGADKAAGLEPSGSTALHAAAYWGHIRIVERLLNAGVQPDTTNKTGATAMHFAANGTQRSSSAEADGRVPHTYAQNVAVARLLIARGANPLLANQDGITALFVAASHDNAGIVELLLAAKAPVDVREKKTGWTPLHAATTIQHRVVLEKQQDRILYRHYVYHDNAEAARLLIAAGARVNAP